MRTLALVLLNCLLGASLTAQAGVFATDLETIGDGLLTCDTINKRLWLDLPETSGMRLAEVLAQMEPGGRLARFQFATLDDVSGLAASAGVGWTTPWVLPFNPEPHVHEVVELLGWVLSLSGGILPETKIVLGLIATNEVGGYPSFDNTNFFVFSMYDEPLHPGSVNHPIYGDPTPRGGVYTDGPVSFPNYPDLPPLGIGDIGPFWLYRTVPEPCGFALLSTSAAWLLLARLRCATPRG